MAKGKRIKEVSPQKAAGKTYESRPLSDEEVNRLLKACRRTATGVRARAMIRVAWRSGLRCSEVLQLRPEHIDRERGLVHVPRPKGGTDRRRTVGISEDALEAVDRWLVERQKLGVGPQSPLFCGIKGKGRGNRLLPSYVRRLMPALAERAGLTRRVHFHALRHSCASAWARAGVPMPEIQAQLGHKSLQTTSTYLAHVAPDQLGRTAERVANGIHKPEPAGMVSREEVQRLIAEALRAAKLSSSE